MNIFVRLLILSASLACFSGCGENAVVPDPEKDPVENKLLFGTWEEYISTNVLAQFTQETGIEVEVVYYGDTEELAASLQEDNIRLDLFIADDTMIRDFTDLKLIQQIDTTRLKNFKELSPAALGRPADPRDRYSLPYFGGITLIVYNKDHIKTPPTSWSDLWNPAYAGKVGVINDSTEMGSVTLRRLGHALDSEDPAILEEAVNSFSELAARARWSGECDDILDAVSEGEIWIAPNYNGDAALWAQEYEALGYVIPREGASCSWMDTIHLARNAQHVEQAYAFLDFLLRPDISAMNANDMCYIPPVSDAIPLTNPSIRDDAMLNIPPEIWAKCPPLPVPTERLNEFYNQLAAIIERINKEDDPLISD